MKLLFYCMAAFCFIGGEIFINAADDTAFRNFGGLYMALSGCCLAIAILAY